MNNKTILFGTLIVIALMLSAYLVMQDGQEKTVLTIFHAGSLSVPFDEMEKIFEEKHPNVDVQREAAGSASTIRKITDLHKDADIVASADYTLIDSMMIDSDTQYADWNILFAKNQLVICYTNQSEFKDEITENNWFEIFNRTGVTYGFSNPNDDPCGYRAVMMFHLAEFCYNDSNLFENIIVKHTDISVTNGDENYAIHVPENLNPDSKIVIRPKETDLMALLESGELDYLIIYRSVAQQHSDSGARFIELSPEIDMSSVDYSGIYDNVSLEQFSDIAGKGETITAKPIVYGITIPSNSENTELALEFVKMVISSEGNNILSDLGQPPITPAKTSQIDNIPPELINLVTEV